MRGSQAQQSCSREHIRLIWTRYIFSQKEMCQKKAKENSFALSKTLYSTVQVSWSQQAGQRQQEGQCWVPPMQASSPLPQGQQALHPLMGEFKAERQQFPSVSSLICPSPE